MQFARPSYFLPVAATLPVVSGGHDTSDTRLTLPPPKIGRSLRTIGVVLSDRASDQ